MSQATDKKKATLSIGWLTEEEKKRLSNSEKNLCCSSLEQYLGTIKMRITIDPSAIYAQKASFGLTLVHAKNDSIMVR